MVRSPTMYLNTTFRIYPKKNEEIILQRLICNFEFQINKVVKLFVERAAITKIRYKEIDNTVPWNSKIEIIKQARKDYLGLIKQNKSEKIFRKTRTHT